MAAGGLLFVSACTTGDEVATGEGDTKIEKVGLMVQDLTNPFFAAMQTRMQEQAKADGFTLNVQDGRQDLAAQNDQIDAFIQQGMDVILINPVDSEGIGSAVERAKAAGITVVAVDANAAGSHAGVTTDNVMAGRLSCEALVEKIGGEGKVLILDGTPISPVQDRVKGCMEVLDATEGITVVGHQNGNNDRATGLSLATDMLTANPDVQGIFAINDPMALGADLAIQQANRTGIWVTGVDGSPEAVIALEDEKSNLWATPAQDPGGMAVRAYEVAREIRGGNEPEEHTALMEPSIVDRDSVGDYAGW
ncbi:ABC transporter substrate-binding protein [Tessaracoccus lubricantis]|uniref:ABC transporter substrate-binding protein n=2 Tax=Tessaracoccus lubricantis TaxID=545543 RepID=A0ABP9F6I0_9ACTN